MTNWLSAKYGPVPFSAAAMSLLLSACQTGDKPSPQVNQPPVASHVSILLPTGDTLLPGMELQGSYVYTDAEQDAEGVTQIRWLRDGRPIQETTGNTYQLSNEDYNLPISFEVTPMANTGTVQGAAVVSGTITMSDTAAPALSLLQAVETPTLETSPTFVIHASEAGSLQIRGTGCTTPTRAIKSGDSTIQLGPLTADQSYDCTVQVTDAAGNPSNEMAIPQFTVVGLKNVELNLFIGLEDTQVELADSYELAYELFRFRGEDCDLSQYASCDTGQMALTYGQETLTDTALTADTTATYAAELQGHHSNRMQITARDGWGGRSTGYLRNVEFAGKVWLIGGLFDTDIYSSTNGMDWQREDTNLPLRTFTETIVFKDKLWVIGGRENGNTRLGDIWSTTDGNNWVRESSKGPFGNREFHQLVNFDDQLWLIGGTSESSNESRDIWRTSDGLQWYQVTADAGMGGLQNHKAISVASDGIFVLDYDWQNKKTKVWKSLTGSGPYTAISELPEALSGFSFVHKDGYFWVFGGVLAIDYLPSHYVYRSADAVTWERLEPSNVYEPFQNADILVFHDRFWRYGGSNESSSFTTHVSSSADGVDWRIPQTTTLTFQEP